MILRSFHYCFGRDALRDADRGDSVFGPQPIRHHERPAAESSQAAARGRSRSHARTAGSDLSGPGTRSQEPLSQRPGIRVGPWTSGPGGSGGAPRVARLEAPPRLLAAEDFVLPGAGDDSGGHLRAAAIRRAARIGWGML